MPTPAPKRAEDVRPVPIAATLVAAVAADKPKSTLVGWCTLRLANMTHGWNPLDAHLKPVDLTISFKATVDPVSRQPVSHHSLRSFGTVIMV